MIDKTNGTYIDRLCYWSPKINVIELKAQNVLCQSNGNAIMYEKDFGDGGFVED